MAEDTSRAVETRQPARETLQRVAAQWALPVLGLGFLILCFLKQKLLFLAAGFAGAVLLLPLAPFFLYVFFAGVLAFSVQVNDDPFTIAGYRFYGADFALYLLFSVVLYGIWRALNEKEQLLTGGARAERVILVLLFAGLAWGVIEIGNALILKHLVARNVFGDFRRIYVYMLAMVLPLGLPVSVRGIRILPAVFTIGAAGAVGWGLIRIGTGVMYRAYTSYSDSPRVLGDCELMTLALFLAYVIAVLLLERNALARLAALGAAGPTVAFMLISGWRYGIGLTVLVPLAVVFLVWRSKSYKIGNYLVAVSVLGLAFAVSVVLVLTVFRDISSYIVMTMQERIYRFGIPIIEDQRGVSYVEAVRLFLENPVLGKGIGHVLTLSVRTSSGDFLYREATTHNIFLDVLYQTGIVGFVLYFGLHVKFFVHCLKRVPRLSPSFKSIGVALFLGYSFTMLLHCFEATQISATVITYLEMGFLLRIFRESFEPAPPAEAAARAEC